MIRSPQDMVMSLVHAGARDAADKKHEAGPLVTIARDLGSGGEVVGRGIAERLGVDFYDKQILDRVAQAAGAEPSTLAALDESVRDRLEHWVSSMIDPSSYKPSDYARHLVTVILSIGFTGGVIMGRGSNIILRQQRPFRLRVVGSEAVCARRMAMTDGLEVSEAAARIHQTNEGRARFVWQTFKIRHDDPLTFDAVVNTDRFLDVSVLVDPLVELARLHVSGAVAANA